MAKARRCKVCKTLLPPNETGRPKIYCSPACRQQAYRKRGRASPALKLMQSDLMAITDKNARLRGAVAVIEREGYAVTLTKIGRPLKPKRHPARHLMVVPPKSDKGD